MKKLLIITTVALAGACAGSNDEERQTAAERERLAERREAERQNEAEPIPSQFDRDGDGEVESGELKQAGVSDEAAEALEADADDTDGDATDRDEPARAHATDADITDQIRDKLEGHDDLSVKAKNVQISTSNGKVTLRGPVETTAEKSKVESCAREVAGTDVDNRLKVAP